MDSTRCGRTQPLKNKSDSHKLVIRTTVVRQAWHEYSSDQHCPSRRLIIVKEGIPKCRLPCSSIGDGLAKSGMVYAYWSSVWGRRLRGVNIGWFEVRTIIETVVCASGRGGGKWNSTPRLSVGR